MSTRPPGPVQAHGLRRLGGRPPIRQYLRDLWQRRWFAYELAYSRFRSENERDRLGLLWVILQPLLNAAVYGVIFGYILYSASRPADFVPYLVSGVFLFQFFAGCLTEGSRAIVGNQGLVTTLHFPRAVLPISLVLKQMFGLGAMVVALLVIVLPFGITPRLSWLLLVPILLLYTVFNVGVAFVAARVTIHLRDVAQLIPFVNRLFFYLSGIFVSIPNVAGNHATLLTVLELNPVYTYIKLTRVALLGPVEDVVGTDYDPVGMWLHGIVWAVGLVLVGFVFFWRAEEEYGRE